MRGAGSGKCVVGIVSLLLIGGGFSVVMLLFWLEIVGVKCEHRGW